MIRPDGVAKVVDFGLARMLERSGDRMPERTQTGSVMGTPRYMSPEQARGGKLDERSDVFSLGAVLFEMAAGSPAFPGATTAEVFAALLHSNPAAAGAGAVDEEFRRLSKGTRSPIRDDGGVFERTAEFPRRAPVRRPPCERISQPAIPTARSQNHRRGCLAVCCRNCHLRMEF